MPEQPGKAAATTTPVALHEQSFVFDATIPGMGFFQEPAVEIKAVRDGGFHGASITVAQQRTNFVQAIENIRLIKRLQEKHATRVCTSVAELERARNDDRLGVILHFQDAKPIEDNLENLTTFYDLGVRIFQLTYNIQGWVGTGCAERHDTGLSTFGLQVVAECNRLGMLVDVSHCAWATAWDAIKHSKEPVAITHTGAHALCAATGRNKPDEMFREIANMGGVVGVCWFSALLKRAPNSHRVVPTSIEDVLDHLDHIVQLVGPDHVGIGSDLSNLHARTLEMPADSSLRWYRPLRPDVFGEGPVDRYDPFPQDLDTHAKARNLTAGMVRRGYDKESIRKILGANWLRLFKQVWRES